VLRLERHRPTSPHRPIGVGVGDASGRRNIMGQRVDRRAHRIADPVEWSKGVHRKPTEPLEQPIDRRFTL